MSAEDTSYAEPSDKVRGLDVDTWDHCTDVDIFAFPQDGKECDWIVLSPDQARALARHLLNAAEDAEQQRAAYRRITDREEVKDRGLRSWED